MGLLAGMSRCSSRCSLTRSDLGCLLERPRCSADGDSPADGVKVQPDGVEGFTTVESSSATVTGSWMTIGWICGTCGVCA